MMNYDMYNPKQSTKSPFLIHWTGRDIDERIKLGNLDEKDAQQEYAQRLVRTLSTGLWMTHQMEDLRCEGSVLTTSKPPMTCFTEVLLTRVKEHTFHYGRLGFGFPRTFVLDQQGSPVLYVRQHPRDPVTERITAILQRLKAAEDLVLDSIDDKLVKTSVKDLVYAHNDLGDANSIMWELIALLKPMSTYGKDDFCYLEECEWRVVFSERHYEISKRMRPSKTQRKRWLHPQKVQWDNPLNAKPSGRTEPPYYLMFEPSDLALLIVPDSETRRVVWQNPEFRKWVDLRIDTPPVILTLDECLSF